MTQLNAGLAAWRARRYRHRSAPSLTPLNERTSALYHACVESGGHSPSGEKIVRYFTGGERMLPICARCRCPYGAPRGNWSSGTG